MSKREPPVLPFSRVVAKNALALRGEHTTDEVARAVTAAGLNWGTGRVADLEAGRVSPTLPTLLVLCQAFGDLLGREVRLSNLLAGEGRVEVVADTLHADLADVRAALNGEPVRLEKPQVTTTELLLRDYLANLSDFGSGPRSRRRRLLLWDIWNQSGEAEERAARALGVDMGQLVEAMADRWGHTLSTERDRLAGPDANAQKRGQIARRLREELRKALSNGDR